MFRSDSFMKTTGLEDEAEELANRRVVQVSASPSASASPRSSASAILSPRDSASASASPSSSASESSSVSVGDSVRHRLSRRTGKAQFVGKGNIVVAFPNGSTGIFRSSELEAI